MLFEKTDACNDISINNQLSKLRIWHNIKINDCDSLLSRCVQINDFYSAFKLYFYNAPLSQDPNLKDSTT